MQKTLFSAHLTFCWSGMRVLHDQAEAIDAEAQMHVGLLDNLDRDVSTVSMDLDGLTKATERLRKGVGNSTCRLYVIIAAELFVLVTLLMLA